jgi:hypothetical protein
MTGHYFFIEAVQWAPLAISRCYADLGDRRVIQFTSLKMSHLDAFEQEPVACMKHLH